MCVCVFVYVYPAICVPGLSSPWITAPGVIWGSAPSRSDGKMASVIFDLPD